ncbi:nuclear transport factor 2 family protein [Streptomyces sp. NPDC102441]|uniref:nuclear transport factor 2 family protein n=1 Tax=Streptomyces sp. NPDC102441 TaxID=3366176 RepID=UPI0037F2E96F
MSTDYQSLIEKFIDVVNEPDNGRRRAGIDALFTEQPEYCDPDIQVEGRDGLAAHLDKLRAGFPPGVSFYLTAKVNGHHNQARFEWAFGTPGAPFAGGSDVVVLEGGRIKRLHAFFN